MRLRGINFRPVMNASGALNFFGQGYPFHRYSKFLGLTWRHCGFIAKTTTMEARLAPNKGKGNMPMLEDGMTPKEFRPDCIRVKPIAGVALNAVGLSGPGAPNLFARHCWQKRTGEPWFLSFMSVQTTASDRATELENFALLASQQLPYFNADIGLEMNFSCPNVCVDPGAVLNEVGNALDIAALLKIPLQVKLNALVPPKVAADIAAHEACDAITMGNTIPWGKLPDRINWQRLFNSTVSPLTHLGGGGLSGKPLLPIICDWIREARDDGLRKPIWACGGIDSIEAVEKVRAVGASGVQLGTVGITRPWRMRTIIRFANEVFTHDPYSPL